MGGKREKDISSLENQWLLFEETRYNGPVCGVSFQYESGEILTVAADVHNDYTLDIVLSDNIFGPGESYHILIRSGAEEKTGTARALGADHIRIDLGRDIDFLTGMERARRLDVEMDEHRLRVPLINFHEGRQRQNACMEKLDRTHQPIVRADPPPVLSQAQKTEAVQGRTAVIPVDPPPVALSEAPPVAMPVPSPVRLAEAPPVVLQESDEDSHAQEGPMSVYQTAPYPFFSTASTPSPEDVGARRSFRNRLKEMGRDDEEPGPVKSPTHGGVAFMTGKTLPLGGEGESLEPQWAEKLGLLEREKEIYRQKLERYEGQGG